MPAHGHSASTTSVSVKQTGYTIVGCKTAHFANFGTTSATYQYGAEGGDAGSSLYINNASASAAHTHTITVKNSGESQVHNNIQPYISVYIWHRVV